MSAGRGAFIVFEGIDRSGKTTQVERVAGALAGEGRRVATMRFPDRASVLGTVIDAYLAGTSEMNDRVAHLLFAANRWEAVPALEGALRAGTTVLVDRYSYSGIAYTAAKGYDPDWCAAPEAGLPRPDSVVYLDLPPGEAAKRAGYGAERYEELPFQTEVHALFARMVAAEGWFRCDATRPPDEITDELVAHVAEVADNVREAPVARIG